MRSELNTHQSYKYEVIKGQSGGVWVFLPFLLLAGLQKQNSAITTMATKDITPRNNSLLDAKCESLSRFQYSGFKMLQDSAIYI